MGGFRQRKIEAEDVVFVDRPRLDGSEHASQSRLAQREPGQLQVRRFSGSAFLGHGRYNAGPAHQTCHEATNGQGDTLGRSDFLQDLPRGSSIPHLSVVRERTVQEDRLPFPMLAHDACRRVANSPDRRTPLQLQCRDAGCNGNLQDIGWDKAGAHLAEIDCQTGWRQFRKL